MTRRIYFSFHYQDVIDFRANVVRNHWVTRTRGEAGFFDASIWGTAKLRGDAAVKRLIDTALLGTSVTCVLVGSYTYSRQWVRYEIVKSVLQKNAILAVHINSIAGKDGRTSPEVQIRCTTLQSGMRTMGRTEHSGSAWTTPGRNTSRSTEGAAFPWQ